MTSKIDVEAELRAAYAKMFPKAIGKMKKHEMEHMLAVLKHKADVSETIGPIPPATDRHAPRTVRVSEVVTGDTKITVPQPPAPRVTHKSPASEKQALREAYGATSVVHVRAPKSGSVPSVGKKGELPPGLAAYHAKRRAEKEAALLAAAPAPAPLVRSGPPAKKPTAAAPPMEEDDTDPKAVRIVKAHKVVAEKKPAVKKDNTADMMAQFEAFLKSREAVKGEEEE